MAEYGLLHCSLPSIASGINFSEKQLEKSLFIVSVLAVLSLAGRWSSYGGFRRQTMTVQS